MALGDTPRVMRPFGFRAAATLAEAGALSAAALEAAPHTLATKHAGGCQIPRSRNQSAIQEEMVSAPDRVARIRHETTAHPPRRIGSGDGCGSFLARRLWNPEDQVSPPRIPKPKQVRPTGGPGRDGVRDVASRNACQRSARRSVATPRHAHASSSGREKTKSGGVDELSRCVSNRHRCFSAVKPSL